MSLAQKDVDSLVKLAERERAGEAVAGQQIADALVSVCKKEVTKLMLSRKLAPVDVEIILIIEHWLEFYGIELEFGIKSDNIINEVTTPISIGALGIASTLFFLTDSESFESLSGNQAVLFLLFVFGITTILRIYIKARMNNSWKMREISTNMLTTMKETILEMKKGDDDV